ncbi:MFS general substrate transporter [Mollisia scopiformis]|uniref:MFS general substrate transporter n=1 Tax=Mollisia scopiformis TaxID=149040 RepID=A0A194XF37_MOLSC|nr:MFS general substrate transporter [Mollisia scopiformis]KUJ18805.1 MFS general substrate transporter [Mollisia scopiformis]
MVGASERSAADIESGAVVTFIEAPGTVVLENSQSKLKHGQDGTLVLYPQPSEDPNDPLNWFYFRKIVNFSLVAFYVLMVFAFQDIPVIVFQDYVDQLGVTYGQLNNTFGLNCAGLALGCLMFIPFSIKYGRRPVYIVTTFVMFFTTIWQARLRTYVSMMGVNLVMGLAGAVADTIVQMTINDLFYLHQRGTMNAIYLIFVNVGVYLAPVAAGYSAQSQGWPWIYWWCTIFFGIVMVIFLFIYEETKYMVMSEGKEVPTSEVLIGEGEKGVQGNEKQPVENATAAHSTRQIDASIPLKSYRQRMTLITKTPGTFKDFLRHFYNPLLMLAIPGVAYTALQYGAFLSWISAVATTESDFFSSDPYDFSTSGIGLLNLAPFIGAVVAAPYSGPLSDWSIIQLAKRNDGIYEPEMRLYLAIFPALVGPAGLFLYGFALAHDAHWIAPMAGVALYGFSQASIQALSLTYLMDSYEEASNIPIFGVCFVRNAIAACIVFAVSPWIEGMGMYNTFVLLGCVALFVMLLCVPIIIWGKKLRILCKGRYAAYAKVQPARRG